MLAVEIASFALVPQVTCSLKVWMLIPSRNPLSLGIAQVSGNSGLFPLASTSWNQAPPAGCGNLLPLAVAGGWSLQPRAARGA